MLEKKWKLGEDMFQSDNLLDDITLYDVILAVKCNCPVITASEIKKTYREILEQRLEDADFLLENNLDEIAEAAMKMREGKI